MLILTHLNTDWLEIFLWIKRKINSNDIFIIFKKLYKNKEVYNLKISRTHLKIILISALASSLLKSKMVSFFKKLKKISSIFSWKMWDMVKLLRLFISLNWIHGFMKMARILWETINTFHFLIYIINIFETDMYIINL